MRRREWGGIAAATVFLGVALAAEPLGVLWQTTSQVSMPGMPYSPAPHSQQLCTHPVWTRPPPGGDPSCKTFDYKIVGNKATWKMACGGRMPMTGVGEMTFNGPDSYTGQITATADGMNMTIALSGKKIGTCDNPQ
ncbi:MAG: hypothetical protein NAOJABEB_02622 [Steroidobacteraceae bacterium]|nr:hypothetical protein [Steroidobacteraceae bacterium]